MLLTENIKEITSLFWGSDEVSYNSGQLPFYSLEYAISTEKY